METVAIDVSHEMRLSNGSARVDDIETVAHTPTPAGASSGSFDSGASAQTMPGSLLGTPAYMSPEQAGGKDIDYRSDIYSLAVVAYALVCGELPFRGNSSEFSAWHRSDTPRSPAGLYKIPPDVSAALAAGLARNPADRPASAIEFTRRFHNAVDAEFLALRRSKAFLLQHLAAYLLLLLPLYSIVITLSALLVSYSEACFRLRRSESCWSRFWRWFCSFFPTTCCVPRRH